MTFHLGPPVAGEVLHGGVHVESGVIDVDRPGRQVLDEQAQALLPLRQTGLGLAPVKDLSLKLAGPGPDSPFQLADPEKGQQAQQHGKGNGQGRPAQPDGRERARRLEKEVFGIAHGLQQSQLLTRLGDPLEAARIHVTDIHEPGHDQVPHLLGLENGGGPG